MQPDHVIVIMTDQQRADMCGREGFGADCTPTVDALARAGTWFDHAYTSAPLCVPARISMLTGRFPSAHGVRENASLVPRYTSDLADVMSRAGFRTALIGKNHSHLDADRFDSFVEYTHFGSGGSPTAFDSWLRELGFKNSMTPAPFPVGEQPPSRLIDETIGWLDANREGRSFTWLSIPEPHVPYQVSEPYFSQFTPDTVPLPETTADDIKHRGFVWQHLLESARHRGEDERAVLLRARATYVGMIRLIDDQIARLVSHLQATGLYERTLIVVVADHGDFAGDYGLLRKGGELAEVLERIPMVFGGGAAPAGGRSDAHVSIVDVLPTMCELIGEPIPQGVQGRSLVGLMTDRPGDAGLREFSSVYAEQGAGGLAYDASYLAASDGVQFTEAGGSYAVPGTLDGATMSGTRRMVRSGPWKVIANADGDVELYNLDDDPWELADISGQPEHAADLARMLALLSAWQVRVADPLPVPPNGYRRRTHPRNYAWDVNHDHEGFGRFVSP